MSNSPRLGLPLLVPGMASKEVVHNEALEQLEMLVQPVVAGAPAAVPTGSEPVGEMLIVASGAIGDFAGHDGDLAVRNQEGWRFFVQGEGMSVFDRSSQQTWRFDGTDWLEGEIEVSGVSVGGIQVVGPQQADIAAPQGGTTVDSEARTAIGSILATLRAHGLIAGAQ